MDFWSCVSSNSSYRLIRVQSMGQFLIGNWIFSRHRLCEYICLVLRSSKAVIDHDHLSSRNYWDCLHEWIRFNRWIYNCWWRSLFEIVVYFIYSCGRLILLRFCLSTFRVDLLTLFHFRIRSLWIWSCVLKRKWILLSFIWRLLLNSDLFCWNVRLWNHTILKVRNLFEFDWWSSRAWIWVRHV